MTTEESFHSTLQFIFIGNYRLDFLVSDAYLLRGIDGSLPLSGSRPRFCVTLRTVSNLHFKQTV